MEAEGKLSVVIPCYNSEHSIRSVIEHNDSIFAGQGITDYEYILVNDCSKDKTSEVIRSMAGERKDITAIDLAKNSGQHAAIMAGFRHASGDYVITCEDDGQTNMEVIGKMFDKLNEGYDVVSTYWVDRGKRSLFRKIGSKINYIVSDALLPNASGAEVSIFFLARRFIIEEIIRYNQPYPFVTGLVMRSTANIATVECVQLPRQAGRSGYNFKKLFMLWLNSFTAFSIVPLRLSSFAGFITAIAGMIYAVVIIVRKIISQDIAAGWSSTTSIILIISGLILCALGIIGEYLGRIYMCINNTPQYVIKEITRSSADS